MKDMDLLGITITGAAALSGTALLVTLCIDGGLPRFWQRRARAPNRIAIVEHCP
ncbi:hypothetical protein NMD95_09680 [Edwardsiella tarda]